MKTISQVLGVSSKIIIGFGVVLSIAQGKWDTAILGVLLMNSILILEKLTKD